MFERFVMPNVSRELFKLAKAKVNKYVVNVSGAEGTGVWVTVGPLVVEISHNRQERELSFRVLYGR